MPKTNSKTNPKAAENMIADRILELLDQGQLPPWSKAWSAGQHGKPCNAITMRPYRGINIWLTLITQQLQGYDDPRWLTFKQANQTGGAVCKGETGTKIVFWKSVTKQKEDNPDRTVTFPVARLYTVFNVEQTKDCDLPPLPDLPPPPDPIAQAEAIIAAMPNPPLIQTYRHRNHAPCYIPPQDTVQVPHPSRYENRERYYDTVYHELVHSTGHPGRLHRFEADQAKDLHDYGVEELVAGMGSAMLAD